MCEQYASETFAANAKTKQQQQEILSVKSTEKLHLFALDMVNLEEAKRIAPGLFAAGKKWFIESIYNVADFNSQETTTEEERDSGQKHQQQQQTASTEYLVHNWLESLFNWFQVIVLWHEPLMSLFAISGLLISFLLLTYFAPRFYATIFIVMFIYNFNKFWFRHVWPDIRVPPGVEREAEMRLDVDRFTYLHPNLMTLAELKQRMKNLIDICGHYLIAMHWLRQHRPVAFCSLICSVLSCTAYIGDTISGSSLLFCALAIIMTAPGIYYQLLPLSMREKFKDALIVMMQKINHPLNIQDERVSGEAQQLETSSQQSFASLERADVESLASIIASNTKTQALSLFEHLRWKSSDQETNAASGGDNSNETSTATTTTWPGNKNNSGGGTMTTVPSPTIDVPHNQDLDRKQMQEERRQRKLLYDEDYDENSSADSRPIRADRRNSNSSLNYSDDEQQDGFVLL